MARLRKFVCYRKVERPYTRVSKFKKYSYVKVNPHIRIVKFDTGPDEKNFQYRLDLISREGVQIRDNAFEAARVTAIKFLDKKIGKNMYHFKIRVHPHHVLRENPMASGAGADRLSKGMKLSFGKPIGKAAQVDEGQIIISVWVNKDYIESAKKALVRAKNKFPCKTTIKVLENKSN